MLYTRLGIYLFFIIAPPLLYFSSEGQVNLTEAVKAYAVVVVIAEVTYQFLQAGKMIRKSFFK